MRRTKEDAQKTRDSILNAAVALFSQKGVTETSLEEIATAANVTRGAIYWHFKNKLEIFDALHERLYQPLTTMILQDIETDHPHPIVQMQDLCIKLLLDIENNPQKRQAMIVFLSSCNYSGELAIYKDIHRQKKEESLQLFTRYFEKAKKQGILNPKANPKMLTLALRCYMKGIIIEHLNDPEIFKMSEKATPLIKLFFHLK